LVDILGYESFCIEIPGQYTCVVGENLQMVFIVLQV